MASWSTAKSILMLHTIVSTTLGTILMFAPSFVPAQLSASPLYAGLLILFGGLFCTIDSKNASVQKSVAMGFGSALAAVAWGLKATIPNITLVDMAILAYLAFSTAAPMLFVETTGSAVKKGK